MFNFLFSTIRYEFSSINTFDIPYFLGSTFRGILGKRLKKTVCIKPFEECGKCEFSKSCPYAIVFETELVFNKPSKYVMKPPFMKKSIQRGETLNLEITLLGEALNYWEFISAAFVDRLNIGKGRILKLKNIYYYDPLKEEYFPVKSFVPHFEMRGILSKRTNKDYLKINLYPTSIKFNRTFIKAKDFNKDLFVKAIVSRVSNVATSYGEKLGKIFIDKEKISLKDINLKPSPMKRWSNRKKKNMIIPAFEGNFIVEGDIQEIYPFLRVIEIINLGKSTSFGLGRTVLS